MKVRGIMYDTSWSFLGKPMVETFDSVVSHVSCRCYLSM